MSSALSTLGGLGRLRRLIRTSGVDLIQCWMYFANVLGSLAARGSGIPVVWGIHGSTLEHLGAPSHFCARLGGALSRRLTDYVINCSTRSADLHAKLGYSAVPNSVIPNGYDPAVFRLDDSAREATRQSLGAEPDTFVVGSLARWHSQKDIPNLLRAVRLAADRGAPLRCALIGRGLDPDNAALAIEIDKTGCNQLVLPLGSRADVPDLARALDLHVLSSSGGEAFPNVVAESMLCGTPNAVTDVGDSALMVGDTGWVVPPGDSAKLAEAIEQAWREWSSPADDWRHRRAAARQGIAGRFTFEKMAGAYEQVWRQVIQTRKPSSVPMIP
jgi:glycosyltransferase involved in cell wall biosynthesis